MSTRAKTEIRYTALPEPWPGRKIERPATHRFRVVTWSQIEKVLQRELSQVGATDVELALDIRNPGYFRQDGGIRADARPATPAVVLSFTDKQGNRLTFPCATYGDWTVNVYAIALSLENLRAVDRYGVTQGDAQYVGFKALPAGVPEKMSVQAAAAILSGESRVEAPAIEQFKMVFESAAKLAQRKAHPDNGGTDDRFAQVQEAIAVLEARHRNG
jgi:hypothetical protein